MSVRILYFFFLLSNALAVCAQRGGGLGPIGNIGQGRGGSSLGPVVRDTSDIFYFFASDPNHIFPFDDSLLTDLHQYDPIRRQPFDYAHLGNLGSAHHPLFYRPSYRQGLNVGLHQFDLYGMTTGDVRFYKIEQAYTHAGFSQGPTQNDAFLNLRFSRSFSGGTNFSIEHNRINNAGAFDNQKALASNVAAGLWIHNKYDTYDGFFSYVSNAVEQQDNGGIAPGADSVYEDAFRLDVALLNSNTRHAGTEYAYTQYFYFNKIFSSESRERREAKKKERSEARAKKKEERRLAKLPAPDTTKVSIKTPLSKDSLAQNKSRPLNSGPQKSRPPNKAGRLENPPNNRLPAEVPHRRLFTLYHQVAWNTASYKFSALPPDSAYFDSFWVDDRGLRHFLETKTFRNTFKLQTFKLRPSTPDSTRRALPAESDLLEVGLVHALHTISQEPLHRRHINNLFLTGRLHFSPNDRIRIRTHAHLGVGAYRGDFRLAGQLFLNFKKIGNLYLEAVNQLSTPPLLHRQFFVSGQQIWKNDFGKILETSLMGTYSLPAFRFSVGGGYHLADNLIYFDHEGLPRQQRGVVSIVQLWLEKDFRAGPFHLDNWLGLQKSTATVVRLPAFYSKHSLYFEGKIFKKVMLTRFGFDARLSSGFTPYGYQPLTGQFFLQNTQSLPFTPLVDAFLSFKVKTFRFFAKAENLLPYLTRQYYFQVAPYPLPFGPDNGGIRLGFNWRLVD